MGFVKNLKVLYDAHMKQVRDRNAEDAYVYDQGLEAGRAEGHAVGEEKGRAEGRAMAAKIFEYIRENPFADDISIAAACKCGLSDVEETRRLFKV